MYSLPLHDLLEPCCKLSANTPTAGDDCGTVESAYGLTHAQFLAWNPAVSADCTSGFWGGKSSILSSPIPASLPSEKRKVSEFIANTHYLDYGYCVGVASSATTTISSSTVASTTSSVPVPSPTQPGIISTCNKYAITQAGDWCTVRSPALFLMISLYLRTLNR